VSTYDETALGRPPRHGRRGKRAQPRRRDPLAATDVRDAEEVRVHGTGRCGCGAEIAVDFTGPDGSLGVRLARARLAAPLCDRCSEEEERERVAADEAERAAERMRHRLERSGIPERWRGLDFSRIDCDAERAEAIAAAQEWALGQRRGVALYGEVGRGKTVIAAAAASASCAAGPVRWLSVAKLLMDLRRPFESPEYERAQQALDASSARSGALVLDDLDKAKPTEHALQPLYVAIDGWITAGKPLLVTLNRDLDSLAEWMGETFGEPIASRVAGYCDVIEVAGRDRRMS